MIMPNFLIPGGFVVLAGRCPVRAVNLLEGNRHLPRQFVNVDRDVGRQVVDVLDVAVGHDDHVTGVVGPPVQANEGGDVFVMIDHVLRLGMLWQHRRAAGKPAKWTIVIFGRVRVSCHPGTIRVPVSPRSARAKFAGSVMIACGPPICTNSTAASILGSILPGAKCPSLMYCWASASVI